MSILTSASSSSVSRGYDYYNNNMVSKIIQLSDVEYEGYVDGSRKTPYYVKINTKHPRKSYCDCPHANGNITCKHMVALYFTLFPDEAEDYENWYENDYDEIEEEYHRYNYYDDMDDDYYYSDVDSFKKPLFFDSILDNFIDNLDENELRKMLKEELKKDEERTFNLYLEDKYNLYLKNKGNDFIFLEKISKKVNELTDYYDYNYNDYSKEILNVREKNKINIMYNDNILRNEIDRLLLVPELTVYNDYKWIANLYKKNKSRDEIEEFVKKLDDYFDSLKHYSIKNSIPKGNVLISIYILRDYTLNEIAISLLKNAKYSNYVDYVLEHCDDYLELYNEVINEAKSNYLKYKRYLPDLLHSFVYIDDFMNKEIYYNFGLYSYLCDGKIEYLGILEHYKNKDRIVKDIEIYTKDVYLLSKLYKYFNMVDKLWNLLDNDKNRYLFINYIDELKDIYNIELYNYFRDEFYNILEIDKKRDIYKRAAVYIEAISKLNDGDIFVKKLILDLEKSEYQKCYTLFEEINMILRK